MWKSSDADGACASHHGDGKVLTLPSYGSEMPMARSGGNRISVTSPPAVLSTEALAKAVHRISTALRAEALPGGHWVGRLSSSALSTATALLALQLARETGRCPLTPDRTSTLIDRGLEWLVDQQNADGGWGDTDLSLSNISTTMLVHAVLHRLGTTEAHHGARVAAERWIHDAGGVSAVLRRYGRDRTFSIPILTHCALAGTVDWKHVLPLPFELACVPARLYAAVRMPVVSYALPALIAIGQAVFHHRSHWNPAVRWIRRASIGPSLKRLSSIQPTNGGFLEATPLTSFVCMSLISCGLIEHPVVRRCLDFIDASAREDGSWPIDTNLSTWVTTLSVNALCDGETEPSGEAMLPPTTRESLTDFLIGQQMTQVHPYTNAAPGGWSWTNLPGAVPDADDTPGAMLALMRLNPVGERSERVSSSLGAAARWLLALQNRDGGWPTFCRGWGTLPFDRSSCDITAHAIRALRQWSDESVEDARLQHRVRSGIERGFRFLSRQQRADGSWLPLWFGNQHHTNDENPLYGTARVLLAYQTADLRDSAEAQAGLAWLISNQNTEGSWGAARNLSGSVEETGLGLEAVCGFAGCGDAGARAAGWLIDRLESGSIGQVTPIGFYFARLWYYEILYPVIFATAGLRAWRRAGLSGEHFELTASSGSD